MNSRRLSGPTTPPSAGAPSSLHSDSSIELEAMSLEELKHKILISQNNIEPSMEADLTELQIFQALDNLSTYQKETQKWRNQKVVDKFISVRNWVLKRKSNSKTIRKLQLKWDGPDLVLYSSKLGSYHLAVLKENELQHPWNDDSLKKNTMFRIILYERLSCEGQSCTSFLVFVESMDRTLFLMKGNSTSEVRFLTRRTQYKTLNSE